jgi:hypothetical protein
VAERITSQVRPPASTGFEVESLPAVGSTLEPATTATVTVLYAPRRTGAVSTSVGVHAGSIEAVTGLTGTATAGSRHLGISVRKVSFGTVRVGRSATRVFELEETGTDNLSVFTARLPAGAFRAEHPLASGSGLIPDAPVPVRVVFRPTRTGHFLGSYVFNARDGQGPETVQLTAIAVS